MVSFKRHIAKTISYRIISTGIGFVTMWAVTGSIKMEPIQYYIHERVWYKWVKYGIKNE